MVSLPRGVAIIRVETPLGRVVFCSDRLNAEEEKVARIMACERVKMGARAVIIGLLEVAAVLRDVA